MTSEPVISRRSEKYYVGIRIQTPMSGMSKQISKLFKELNSWISKNEIKQVGPPFLRYHVIDMKGEMDIEACIPVKKGTLGTANIKPDILPSGKYAHLIYSGSGILGNKALIEWIGIKGLHFDRWNSAKGDNFRSRYETYLTDPKIQPLKTKWEIEVAIKLAD